MLLQQSFALTNALSQGAFLLSPAPFLTVAGSILLCRKANRYCRKLHSYGIFGKCLHKLWYVPQLKHNVKNTRLVFPRKRDVTADSSGSYGRK